jgi:pyruvate dehydrogenase E2 component (dihydrolipoamide acetyltransferase)
MAVSLVMPALEMAQDTGTLIRWLKREGETVAKGEPVMEIETDKTTTEVESPAEGVLGGILAKEGDVVPVGRTIGWILAPGEKAPPPEAGTPTAPVPSEAALQAPGFPPASVAVSSSGTRLAPASPKARRLAAERGVSLESARGSGPGGAVLAADLGSVGGSAAKVMDGAAASPPAAARAAEAYQGYGGKPGTTWRLMAERTSASWRAAPHFHLVREADAGGLIDVLERLAPLVEKKAGIKPTYTDLFVKMLAVAVRSHPRLNAAWVDGEIRYGGGVNVGIATAVEEGLVVPVIAGADRASVGEIAAARSSLVERARNRALRPADVADGTVTLTNLGMYNVDAFDAVLSGPQAAILAVGRIAERVVAVDGKPAVRPTVVLTLACDHRVVDGARAAMMLDELVGLMENPWRLLA